MTKTHITKEDVDKLAELARIEMSDAEKNDIQKELQGILGYVSDIQKLATSEPPEEERIGIIKNVMRDDDEAHPEGIYTDEMINSAPQSENNYIKVKKILP